MRKFLLVAAVGAAALAAPLITPAAQAQPYGYPRVIPVAQPGYRYDEFGRPYFDEGYRAYGRYRDDYVPHDRFGADPNGMIAADGHRIKCKLQDDYDGYGRYMTRRVCW